MKSLSSNATSLINGKMSSTESLSSNPESPASPVNIITQTLISGQNDDFNSQTYANELLERGLKEERFRIDRKKLEDMLQIQQGEYLAEQMKFFDAILRCLITKYIMIVS